jgi:hypothetical protein
MRQNNPTNMGDQTTRLFNRVANDMRRFANNIHGYDDSFQAGDQWYNTHNKTKPTVGKPTVKPKIVSTFPPRNVERHVRRKPLR